MSKRDELMDSMTNQMAANMAVMFHGGHKGRLTDALTAGIREKRIKYLKHDANLWIKFTSQREGLTEDQLAEAIFKELDDHAQTMTAHIQGVPIPQMVEAKRTYIMENCPKVAELRTYNETRGMTNFMSLMF